MLQASCGVVAVGRVCDRVRLEQQRIRDRVKARIMVRVAQRVVQRAGCASADLRTVRVSVANRDIPSHLRTHGKMLLNLYQTVFSGALEAVQVAGGSDMAVTQCHLHLMRALLLLAPIGEAEMDQSVVEQVSSPDKPPAGRRARRDSTAVLMEQLGLTELIEVPGAKSRAVRKVAHPNHKYMVGADGANSLVLLGMLSEGGFQAARDQVCTNPIQTQTQTPTSTLTPTARVYSSLDRSTGIHMWAYFCPNSAWA